MQRHCMVMESITRNCLSACERQACIIRDDGRRRPVCYAHRSVTDTKKLYAVIEKEALAATCACEKFREYVMGIRFTIETDHKPLVPLLKTTARASQDATSHPAVSNETGAIQPRSRTRTRKATDDTIYKCTVLLLIQNMRSYVIMACYVLSYNNMYS